MHTTSLAEPNSADARDARLLIAALQKVAMERLSAALDAVLRRADDYLFDNTGQGGEAGELTALRDLRRARAQIAQHFTHNLLAGFQRLQLGAVPASGTIELSLLSEDALEEQLATEQLVDSLARKHAAALELLDQRIAVVVERTILAADENPVAPAFLAAALHGALHTVELSTALRIALYKFTERELSTALTALYDRLNAYLAEAGVLPRLLPTVRSETGAAPASAEAGPDGDPHASVEVPANEQALFGSLIGMLQSWRQRMAPNLQGAEGTANNAPQLRMPEIMSVLSLMQNDPPPALDLALDDQKLSLAEQLRREVLAGARRLGIGGEGLNLTNMQEDAVDLVGMLFDVLLDERDFEPNVRRKIGRMLVPYVKVAVKDRRLFLYKGHPARRFLNAVAEACEGNHADGPQERELLERVDTYIDSVELVEPEPAPVQQQAAAPSLRIVGGHDQLDFDPTMAERLHALEVGTWLQLAGESGKLEQAKVSWISPISSRFLFVNRRGIRVLVASAEELAAMAKQGRLQLRQADTAFDDAMHQIMGRLQSGASA
jgi:hypothetical protein